MNRDADKVGLCRVAPFPPFALFYFNFIVVQFSPWCDPRYFISIVVLLVGNSMTGITLGVAALTGYQANRKELEAALM